MLARSLHFGQGLPERTARRAKWLVPAALAMLLLSSWVAFGTAARPLLEPLGHSAGGSAASSGGRVGVEASAGPAGPPSVVPRTITLSSILGSRAPTGGLASAPFPMAAPPPRVAGLMTGTPSPPAALSTPAASNLSMHLQYVHDGLDFNSAGGTTPPDVQVAVGPSQVVEFVNVYGEVFNLTGVPRTSFFLGSFFGTGSDYLSDPKILYDNESSRWYASILHYDSASGNYDNRLAVSTGTNFLGTWHIYTLTDTPAGSLGDQPILGISSKLIAISVNLFTSSNGGVEFWIVNKSSAMSGGPLAYHTYGPMFSTSDSSIHPVQGVTPNDTLFMVEVGPSSTQLRLIEVHGVPPAAVTFTNSSLSIGSVTPAPSAVQPGSSLQLDTGDARVQSAVWSSGALWLGFNDQCRPAGDTSNRACFRLVDVNTSSTTVSQEFDVGTARAYLYYPSLALNTRGDLTVVYGESSGSVYPSILVTGRLASDPSGTLLPPATMRSGTADLTAGCSGSTCRYGDYFGAGESPGNSTAWVAGEWNGGTAYWSTAVGEAGRPVPPVPKAQLTASTTVLDVGQGTTLTFRLLNSTCVNSTGDHCTVVLPFPSSPYSASCVSPFSTVTQTVSFSQPGTYSLGLGGYVAVYASPSCAGSPSQNVSVTPVVVTVYALPTVTITSSTTFPVETHEPFTLHAAVANGAGTIGYLWSGLPAGCTNSFGPVQPCSPGGSGPVSLSVNVTDRTGASAVATLSLFVVPNPTVSIASDVSTLDVGLPIDFTASGSGGIGVLTYAWTALPTGCISSDQSQLICVPTQAGTFGTGVSVNDSLGFQASSNNLSLIVYPAPSVTISTSAPSPLVGTSFTLTGVTSGGEPPYSFSWTGTPPGCSPSISAFVACTATAAGRYTIGVDIADAAGGHASRQLNLTVTSVPTPSSPPSTPSPLPFIIVGVAIIALALLVIVLVARRRRLPDNRRPSPRGPGGPARR